MIDEKKLDKEIADWFKKAIDNGNHEVDTVDTSAVVRHIIDNQPRVGDWIPCSERLPDEEGMYLITARVYDKKEIQYAFYQKEIGLFICNGTAIAWMPLPPAYKEGK